jgi:hypothetical protein
MWRVAQRLLHVLHDVAPCSEAGDRTGKGRPACGAECTARSQRGPPFIWASTAGELVLDEFVRPVALQVEEGGEVAVLDAGVRGGRDGGLGAVGDA